MKHKTLAQIFPPGDFLKEILESRGWSQADLADILARPPRLISEIIGAKRAITPETAHGLGEAFGTGAEFWMRLEASYQLSLIKTDTDIVARRARLFGQFPIKDMQKRGWLKAAKSLEEIERQLSVFLGVASLDENALIRHVAKKTSYEKVTPLQTAWLARARELAPAVAADEYDANNLTDLYKRLRQCVEKLEDSAKVPALLAEAGIRLLVIEPLPGSRIDAACLWLCKTRPVIVLTLRYDRHDIFWHALFHELDHLQHGEGLSQPVVDANLMGDCSHGEDTEKRANTAAANILVPQKELERFISSAKPYFSEREIVSFAQAQRVHPGIVVGQLQHHKLLSFSSFNKLKAKIRTELIKTTVTDGFGRLLV
jgi:HTH-type transcriptional regulator/antitoxin HigA